MSEILSFNTIAFSSSIARPANATAYAIGDAISAGGTNNFFVFGEAYDEVTARTKPHLAPMNGISRNTGRSCVINSLLITSSNSTATVLQSALWLFSKSIPETVDNAEFAPSLADLRTYLVAIIPIPEAAWNRTDNGNVCWLPNLDIVTTFPDPGDYSIVTGQVFGQLVTRAAYTPISGEVIDIRLVFTRD